MLSDCKDIPFKKTPSNRVYADLTTVGEKKNEIEVRLRIRGNTLIEILLELSRGQCKFISQMNSRF